MTEKKADLTVAKNFFNWVFYGLCGVISSVSVTAYLDMRSQRDKCQIENNYFARQSFDNALQKKVIDVQAEAIEEAKTYITDSLEAARTKESINLKNKNK